MYHIIPNFYFSLRFLCASRGEGTGCVPQRYLRNKVYDSGTCKAKLDMRRFYCFVSCGSWAGPKEAQGGPKVGPRHTLKRGSCPPLICVHKSVIMVLLLLARSNWTYKMAFACVRGESLWGQWKIGVFRVSRFGFV